MYNYPSHTAVPVRYGKRFGKFLAALPVMREAPYYININNIAVFSLQHSAVMNARTEPGYCTVYLFTTCSIRMPHAVYYVLYYVTRIHSTLHI